MQMLLRNRTAACALLALATPLAHGDTFFFSTGNPDALMAMAAIPGTLTADDFVLSDTTDVTGAAFYGLMSGIATVASVRVDVFRVFPVDSGIFSGNVPTRTNSPSDVPYDDSTRISGVDLAFTTTELNASFTTSNSVLLGIHPSPNQTTGGEGGVNGQELILTVTFKPPIVLPADHYFIALQVQPSLGPFYWLSAPKPIASPGNPFSPDLQAWIRNANITPDWLRVGTDIVGGGPAPTFNAAFSLTGVSDLIFRNSFDPP